MPKVLVDNWFYESCPLASDCTPGSWKRAKCNGRCQAQARLALKQHLLNSGNHQISRQDADRVVRGADLKHEQYYERQADGPSRGQQEKSPSRGDEKGDKVEDDKKKSRIVDDKKTARAEDEKKNAKGEDEKKNAKLEELEEPKGRPIKLSPNDKRKMDDSIQEIKSEVSSDDGKSDNEEKSDSVVSSQNKKLKLNDPVVDKRKLNDTDLDKLLFDAANKVQQGLNCVAIAQVNMEEARDAVRRMQAVVEGIRKSMPLDVD